MATYTRKSILIVHIWTILKVLFLTGYAHNAAVGNGLLEVRMQIVAKPFTVDKFADQVTSMLI